MERLIRLVKEYQRLDALSKSSTSLTPQEAQRKREAAKEAKTETDAKTAKEKKIIPA